MRDYSKVVENKQLRCGPRGMGETELMVTTYPNLFTLWAVLREYLIYIFPWFTVERGQQLPSTAVTVPSQGAQGFSVTRVSLHQR